MLGGEVIYERAIILAFTSASVCMDLKNEKISNMWILFGWCTGLIYQIFLKGPGRIPYFLYGSAMPVMFLFILFSARMLGAGDIKLLSVIGGLMGPFTVFKCILYSFLCGAVLSAAILIFCGGLKNRFQYFFSYFQQCFQLKKRIPYRLEGRNRPEHLHFSVAILMGVLLWIGGIY